MTDAQLERIEKYLTQKLPKAECQEVERQYLADSEFAEQLDTFRLSMEAVEMLGQESIKNSFRAQYFAEKE